MTQVTLYFDSDVAERLTAAAKRAGRSRSAWVGELVVRELNQSPAALPDWWWKNLGTWEDDRSAQEILEDIGAHLVQTDEPELD